MNANFDSLLYHVLMHEGGFVNHPKDPGGMTNLGVTKRVWEEWIGRPATEQDMRMLTPSVVGPLYKKRYWDRVCGDDLPAGVDYSVFDCAVNSGPGRAARFLQQVVGAGVDGAIGPNTLEKTKAMDAAHIVEEYNRMRLEFLKALPTWTTFGVGWGRRVGDVLLKSLQLATDGVK